MTKATATRVQKDGRITIPRRLVEAAGLVPQDEVNLKDVELTKQGKHRRAFLRSLRDAGIGGLLWAMVAKPADFEGDLQFLKRLGIYDADADKTRVKRLFGTDERGAVAIVPAADHPFKPPVQGFYETELNNANAYRRTFCGAATIRTVKGFPRIRPDDSVVLFGSQVSNLSSRLLFGNPFGQSEPSLKIQGELRDWQAALRWNLFSPEKAETITRQQFGAPWMTKNHRIGECTGNIYESKLTSGAIEDDFLLVTVLPRFRSGAQKVVVFAGCHGPAQKAATALLSGNWTHELIRVEREIKDEPFYQALFHADITADAEGELVPRGLELVGAVPLDIEFASF